MKKSIIATLTAFLTIVGLAYCSTDITSVEDVPVVTPVTTNITTTTNTTSAVTTESVTTVTTTNVTTETTTEVIIETEQEKPVETEASTETVVESSTELIVESESQVKSVETESVETEEYLVYKPSTHYIHRNSCRWNSGDAYRVDCTTELVARLCDECNPDISDFIEYVEPEPEIKEPTTISSEGLTYFGYFGRVTYYPATAYYSGVCGGSGRTLMGYDYYDNGIRGSIASRTLYETYGYNRNGRTTVYLEFPGYENMNGYYYVDDCCRDYGVIDIFVWSSGSCPFYNAGVITADCYV